MTNYKSVLRFKLSLDFPYSEAITSALTYSRMRRALSENLDQLESLNQDLLQLVRE